ncbi:DUF6443 domain-containing protein [Puia dinghuensis]|uniref:DUF6443 domain-containing protein n=1 Tax=Puia dinghuensis TaxID=1792502 RepID=A0A8J2UHV0_9BACT|nr:DUF6443 domain-containing protein [Puia dinghuensis]GGB19828.1 hypothetical protein GCM10011511_49480 [Puia dinghuensis]
MRSIALFFLLTVGLFAGTATVLGQSNKPNAASTIPGASNVHTPGTYGSSASANSISTLDAMGPYQNTVDLLAAGYLHVKENNQYLDGLGRPAQTVSRQVTPAGIDLVTPMEYDAMGREAYKYLAYVSGATDGNFRVDPFDEQKAYLSAQYTAPAEGVFYSNINFESSPLSRPVLSMSPGNSWAGNGVGIGQQYLENTAADGVQKWNISSNALTYSNNDVTTNIPVSAGAYGAGVLHKNITIDEAGHVKVDYVDMLGRTILKKVQAGTIASDYSGDAGFLCTYYIYDDLNQLRFIIPPKAVQALEGSWSLSGATGILNELCFRYEFDSRRRLIAKKTPGTGWEYLIYDTRDRLVFTQDGNLRTKGQWMTSLYDPLDRPIITGITTYGSDPASFQQAVTTATVTPAQPSGLQWDLPPLASPNTTGNYQALHSITLAPGFSTPSGGPFSATIVNGAGEPVHIVEGRSVDKDPIPAGATFVSLTHTYYDDYSWTTKTFNSGYNSKLDAGTNLHAETPPTAASTWTTGMVTGVKVRIISDPNNLAAGSFLATVDFYDDKGRVIQTQADNEKGGNDITTQLYDFTGKVLCSYLDLNNPGGTPAETTVKTTHLYDHAGRLLQTHKMINDDNTKQVLIANNQYDELGRLVSKRLGQTRASDGTYTATPLETLGYTYNVRGWLQGINKDYSTPGGTDAHWFGMELNYDWGFNSNQLNGNIAGVKWRSKGGGESRSYGFTYDDANRLMSGDFAQYDGSLYSDNAAINFDAYMGDGLDPTKAYDANGNIVQMQQWGLALDGSHQIDNLAYSYFTNSNKLQTVSDGISANYHLGDFTDNNIQSTGYGYDLNGNMITDLNKRITGATGLDQTSGGAISYNYQNLPAQVPFQDAQGNNKGTISYTYDAVGNKLDKIVVDKSVAGSTITTTTRYIGEFVYETKTGDPTQPAYADVLQFFGHDEGRTRYVIPPGGGTGNFVYDYFVKDHLGDVRVVLTDELAQDQYPVVDFEDANVSTEEIYYNNVDVQRTARPGAFFTSNTNGNQAQVLSKTTQPVGAGKLDKVMAGDLLDIKVDYYIPTATTDNSGANGLNSVLSSLLTLLNGSLAPAPLHGSAATINGNLNADPIFSGFFTPETSSSTDLNPKAYLNILFFDDQFKFVQQNSELVELTTEGSGQTVTRIGATAKVAPRNGYVYIYLSNESNNLVYFDNFQVTHEHGPLLEETHYYPFGLTMAGISSKAVKTKYAQNRYRYNGKELQNQEFSDGSGLEEYDYGARMYEPQIGRWNVIDPHAADYSQFSPYLYVGSNPMLLVDPNGKDWFYYKDPGDQDADATWHWHDGNQYNTGVKDADGNDVILQGVTAVVEFDGSKAEKLDANGKFNTWGAVAAEVTVYGPDGANDVHHYSGYTMSSDPDHYGVVADGMYDANYRDPGKTGPLASNWAVNDTRGVPAMNGYDPYTGKTYVDGVYIHRSNLDGFAGVKKNSKGQMVAISKGCLLINPDQWADFNKVMHGVQNFKVQIDRTKLTTKLLMAKVVEMMVFKAYMNLFKTSILDFGPPHEMDNPKTYYMLK